ncbi:MAG: ribonuclease HII [Ignavibacteriae bacterium]|nr:ribonuclease HII [Ignavibacteria bacterium]MBI3363610.1 ribonuclease HII [Ignavibacteriota bacterium]
MLDCAFERTYWMQGIEHVAGIDEAGRGPLAGPVVAAAVVMPREVWIHGVDDSKKLSAVRREELFDVISECALAVGVGIVHHTIIDEINIYRATMKAMADAVAQLTPVPGRLLIDGPRYHDSSIPFTAIVDGDAKCFSIAAASIIAKVTRDRLMVEYDRLFPDYGFAKHKGYGTREHLDAIRTHGPCSIHRRSFSMPTKNDTGGYEHTQ